MNNGYIIKESEVEQYDFFIYSTRGENVLNHLDDIEEELSNYDNVDQQSSILFDTLLYGGNRSERFISADYINGKFDRESFEFMTIPKNDIIRDVSLDFFSGHRHFIEKSGILNSVEKKVLFHEMDAMSNENYVKPQFLKAVVLDNEDSKDEVPKVTFKALEDFTVTVQGESMDVSKGDYSGTFSLSDNKTIRSMQVGQLKKMEKSTHAPNMWLDAVSSMKGDYAIPTDSLIMDTDIAVVAPYDQQPLTVKDLETNRNKKVGPITIENSLIQNSIIHSLDNVDKEWLNIKNSKVISSDYNLLGNDSLQLDGEIVKDVSLSKNDTMYKLETTQYDNGYYENKLVYIGDEPLSLVSGRESITVEPSSKSGSIRITSVEGQDKLVAAVEQGKLGRSWIDESSVVVCNHMDASDIVLSDNTELITEGNIVMDTVALNKTILAGDSLKVFDTRLNSVLIDSESSVDINTSMVNNVYGKVNRLVVNGSGIDNTVVANYVTVTDSTIQGALLNDVNGNMVDIIPNVLDNTKILESHINSEYPIMIQNSTVEDKSIDGWQNDYYGSVIIKSGNEQQVPTLDDFTRVSNIQKYDYVTSIGFEDAVGFDQTDVFKEQGLLDEPDITMTTDLKKESSSELDFL